MFNKMLFSEITHIDYRILSMLNLKYPIIPPNNDEIWNYNKYLIKLWREIVVQGIYIEKNDENLVELLKQQYSDLRVDIFDMMLKVQQKEWFIV